MALTDGQSNAISGAAGSLLGAGASIAGGLMSRKENEVAARKQFEYNATLQNEAAQHNREAMALQHGYNMDMANLNQQNAMAMLQAQQDYNTRFAFNSQKMQANALRGAGLNPAAASAQLLQPGVSGPAAGSGQGSSAVGIGAAGSGLLADPLAGSMNAAGALLGNSVLNITQSMKNLSDAGKSGSEKELNEIESKYRDKMLQQQIVAQGLQNGILDYELSYKISTYDESIKALVLSNIESLSRADLNDQQRETAAAQQKQLMALTDNLNEQTRRIQELLPAEKRELFTRAANNSAQAFLAKEMGNTEESKRKWYGSMRNLNDASYISARKDSAIKQFELDVKNEIGVKEYAKLEQAGVNLQKYAEEWYEARTRSEIFRNIAGPIMSGVYSATH